MRNKVAEIGDTVKIISKVSNHPFKLGQLIIAIGKDVDSSIIFSDGKKEHWVIYSDYEVITSKSLSFEYLQEKVIQWGKDKGILVPENAHKQALKMVSEVGELCDELIKNDQQSFKNEFGDVLVTLIILAEQTDVSLTECLQLAYNKIKDRKGKTESGIFIKE